MAAQMQQGNTRKGNPWRLAVWGTAAGLLLLPAIAMQLGVEGVLWTASDFVVMGVLLGSCCLAYEVATRMSGSTAYRLGFAVAIVLGFLLVWINLAVGIIGGEANPANLVFAGVLAVGLVGALIEAALTMALGEVLGLESAALTVTPGASEPPPPAPGCDLVLAIDQPGTPAWTIKLSLPQAGLVEWLVPRRARPAGPRSADPAAPPFADLPLPLSARLVDMRLPLSAVARLTPGMVLPVAVARAVPVEVGGVVIARGTVGNQDDRIAIKLTQIA